MEGRTVMRKIRGGRWRKGVVSVFDTDANTFEVRWENGEREPLSPSQLASIMTRTGGRPDEQAHGAGSCSAPDEQAHGAGSHSASDKESGSSDESADDAAIIVDADEADEDAVDLAAVPAMELLPAAADLEHETVAHLHQALMEAAEREAESFTMPLHRDFLRSGITIDYAKPKYTLPTHSRALLEWVDKQGDDEEFEDMLALTDLNCRLDFADWVQRNQTSHREYRALVELVTKWAPKECMPEGKEHPEAYLLRMLKTRKGLEEHVDRRIAKRQQASLRTARMQ